MVCTVWHHTFFLAAGHSTVERLLQPLIRPGPEVIKLFPCSTQLSTKFILLINVKMPTIVGILALISMINSSERLKAIICIFKWLKFRTQLS